jgi:enamine deaminase RidA (YjgF/YER057c/UK114 family)
MLCAGDEMPRIDDRLAALGIELPRPSTPAANYIPWVRTGNLIHVAGQISQWQGERRFIGKLGKDFSVDEGRAAARLVVLNVLAQVRDATGGDLDKVRRVVKLNGFVNGVQEFTDQPAVINGASDLLVEIFGEAGRHARSSVGVASLPFGVAVEIDAIFEVD